MNKLRYEKITLENLEIALEIQNEIFPLENAKNNYLEAINNNPLRKEQTYWIIYNDSDIIGISGIYSYHEFPFDAWLGWFGVKEKYRKLGYGSKILDDFEIYAISKGYKTMRLYTDEVLNNEAYKIYLNRGMTVEKYFNELEKVSTDFIRIFSKSLDGSDLELWDSKFLDFSEQIEKEQDGD